MKILPAGGDSFHGGGRADGRTDTTKLVVAFCNFANAPENERLHKYTTAVM